jgi:hypothetical protein
MGIKSGRRFTARCRRRKKRLEEEDDMWDPPGSGRERDSGVGWVVRAAAGLRPARVGFGPRARPKWAGFFFFFCSKFFFHFLFLFFFYNFCNLAPNRFKQLCKIF